MLVEFFSSSVSGFIEAQQPKVVKKIMSRLEMLEKHGLDFCTHSGTVKFLRNGIYEVLIRFNHVFYRFLFAIRQAVYWILHGFKKKSNKTPAKELDLAIKRARILDRKLAI